MEGYIKAGDGLHISYGYFPAENARAAIHLVHGAMEHKERYYDFIHYLNRCGYSCIISDLRGHGHSVNKRYVFGHMEEPKEMLEDLRQITELLKKREPGKKIFMFGHSLGSMLARNFLKEHDDLLSGLVLCGTVRPEKAAGLAVALSKLICPLTGGSYGRSRVITGLVSLSRPAGEWISYNPENVKNFYRSHLGAMRFDNGAALTSIRLVRGLSEYKEYKVKNPILPILSVSGTDDPVTKGSRGLAASKRALEKAGYKNIQIKQYEHMMHEILHEKNKEIVYRDVANFFDKTSECSC